MKPTSGNNRRRQSLWLLLTLGLLPILASCAWYGLRVRQQRLDRALIEASKKNDTKTAIALLDQGADANATDKPYSSITFQEAFAEWWNRLTHDQTQVEKTIYAPAITLIYPNLMPGPDFNSSENLPLLRAFAEHGANLNASNYRGFTILHKATLMKHSETVQYLLEHDADPDPSNDDGYTPLDWSNARIAAMLLKHGADVNHRNVYNTTPLVSAVAEENLPLVTLLLEAHAETNTQDIHGNTSLHFLLMHEKQQSGKEAIVRELARLLLMHGARVDIKDKKGKSALDYAREDHIKVLIPLLDVALKKEQAEQKSSLGAE